MESLLHSLNLYPAFSDSFRACHFLSPKFSSNQVQFFLPANRKPRTTRPLTMALSAGNSSIQEQKVVIPNKYGEKLGGILYETGSHEIVILCHGFQATKEHIIMVNLASSLGNVGLASFRFDFPGNGESEGSFQYGNYWREADDIHAVAQHFRGLNRMVNAIVGHSKGGDVVLLYASKYNDLSVVVNISGRYDLRTGIAARLGEDFMDRIKKEGFIDVKKSSVGFESNNYRVTEESLMDRLNTNMHEACLQIDKKCRVLTVHGSADTVIPVEDALEFAKIIPNHKLHIIEGADHRFNNHQSELVSLVVNFIMETKEQDKGWNESANKYTPTI